MNHNEERAMSEDRLVLYVAHPLRPTLDQFGLSKAATPEAHTAAIRANLERAMRWLRWLRRSFPNTTFVAPWIAAVLSGEDDTDPRQREAGLVDADAVIPRLDGVVLCGGRISSGMGREDGRARRSWDLTGLGDEPPDGTRCADPRPGSMDWTYWAESLER